MPSPYSALNPEKSPTCVGPRSRGEQLTPEENDPFPSGRQLGITRTGAVISQAGRSAEIEEMRSRASSPAGELCFVALWFRCAPGEPLVRSDALLMGSPECGFLCALAERGSSLALRGRTGRMRPRREPS